MCDMGFYIRRVLQIPVVNHDLPHQNSTKKTIVVYHLFLRHTHMGLQNLQIACQAKLSDFGFAQRCLRGMFRGLQAGLPLGFMTLLHDLIGYIIAFPRYSLSFFLG
jgi:hypothetical protein